MRHKLLRPIAILGVILLAAAAAGVALTADLQAKVTKWFNGNQLGSAPASAEAPSHELLRDAITKRPTQPIVMRLSAAAHAGLKIAVMPVTQPGPLVLPPQTGSLGYDNELLFPVRPPFQGEIIELGTTKEAVANGSGSQQQWRVRPLAVGDHVDKDTVLAVTWCKEIADRKVTLISALLDLHLEEENRKLMQISAGHGAMSSASLLIQRNKVEKALAAVFAAETSLGIARMQPAEIEQIRLEAEAIGQRLQDKPQTPEQGRERIEKEVKKLARVEIRAPQAGVIVEKNTNLHDMVDPTKDIPLYRIADLRSLLVVASFHEEYLPLLQPLLRDTSQGRLSWKIKLQAQPELGTLDLPILRVAPSVDPNQHTVTVYGRIPNPVDYDRPTQLVVGQFLAASLEVPPPVGAVQIPTNALNEVNGESLVFVQPDADKREYVLRRVLVVRRAMDFTLVKATMSAKDAEFSAQEIKAGRRPVEPLCTQDRVVTHGVTEMTDALEELLTKLRAEN